MAEAEIKAKGQRTARRGRATRAAQNLTKLISSKEISPVAVKTAIEDLDKALVALQEAQEAVESFLQDEEEIIAEVNSAADFEEKCKTPKIEALCWLEEHNSVGLTPSAAVGSDEGSSHVSSAREGRHLPKLEMPHFDGNFLNWQSFWDQFTAIVHQSDLPVVTKFSYLRSLLKGEASAAITGLSLSEQHYEDARELLEQRFGRKDRIVFAHLQELLSITVPEFPNCSHTGCAGSTAHSCEKFGAIGHHR